MRIVFVDSGDYSRDRREEMVELSKQRVPDIRNRLCVHLLVVTALLCLGCGGFVRIVGPLLVVAKKTPVENQVNVFREAVNQPEDLGEACAAFKDHLILQGRFRKEEFENPADPEVLLDNGGVPNRAALPTPGNNPPLPERVADQPFS